MIETRDSQDPIRVILVDDHQAILEGMTTWINRQPDMQIVTADRIGIRCQSGHETDRERGSASCDC